MVVYFNVFLSKKMDPVRTRMLVSRLAIVIYRLRFFTNGNFCRSQT